MSLPTVASLCATLGHHLAPVSGFRAPDVHITAVHISELLDPNAYLSGGELLLTTGLALPSNEIGCRRYIARLIEADVSALALGLGPVHRESPDVLVRACRDAGLTLLEVPAPTPFLMVSRAYWTARSRSAEQRLNDAVAAHRALVDAAVAPDPAAAILKRLAQLLGGWAALLTDRGAVDQIYPVSMGDEVEVLRAEVARLEVAGVHSSASFVVGENVVIVYPLAVHERIVGYVAAGSPRELEASQRRVVLTAAALLSLDALRDQRSESAREATRRCVALLLDGGMDNAAHWLATKTGTPAPGLEATLVAARGRDSEDLAQEVERWCPDALAVAVNRSTVWFILPDDHGPLSELEERLRAVDPQVAAVAHQLVGAGRVGPSRSRLLQTLSTLQPGEVILPRVGGGESLRRAIATFLSEANPEVREALVAYLRHRGQWEQTSRSLGLHRNTVRYRVGRARDILGLNLEDPDVAAQTWLALRAEGAA